MSEKKNQLQEERRLPEEIEGTLLLNLSDTRQERLDTLLTEYRNFAAPYIARGQQQRAQAEQSGDRTALARNDELLKALHECRQRTLNLKQEISTEGEKVSESVVNQIAAIEEHFSVLRTLLSELDEVTKAQAAVNQADQQHNAEIISRRKVVFPGWVKSTTIQDAFATHLQRAQFTLELDQTPGHIPIEKRAKTAAGKLLQKLNPSPNGDRVARAVTIESADEAQALMTVCDEVLRHITMYQGQLTVRGTKADPRVEKQYAEVRALREQLTQVENTFNSPLLDTFGIIDELEDRQLSQKKQSLTKDIQTCMSTITRAISGFNFDHGWIDGRVGGLHRKSAVLWLEGHDYSNEFNKAYPPGGLREAYEFSSLPGQDEPIALSVWRNAFMIDEKKWLEFRAKINAQMSGQVSIDAERKNVGARVQRAATSPVPDFADAHGDDFEPELRSSHQAPRRAVAEPAPRVQERDSLEDWLSEEPQPAELKPAQEPVPPPIRVEPRRTDERRQPVTPPPPKPEPAATHGHPAHDSTPPKSAAQPVEEPAAPAADATHEGDSHAHTESHDNHHDSDAPKLTRAQKMVRDLLKNRKRTIHSDAAAENSAAAKSAPEIIPNPLAPRPAPKAAVNSEVAKPTIAELRYGNPQMNEAEKLVLEQVTRQAGVYLSLPGIENEKNVRLQRNLLNTATVLSYAVRPVHGDAEKIMEKNGISELISLGPCLSKVTTHETVMKTKGLLRRLQAVEVPVTHYQPLLHKDLVYHGEDLPAYIIKYTFANEEYTVRGKKRVLNVELVLPEKLARETFELIKNNPQFIRRIIDGFILSEMQCDGPAWGDYFDQNPNDTEIKPSTVYVERLGPPYERIRKKSKTKVCFDPDSLTPEKSGKEGKWFDKKNIREI